MCGLKWGAQEQFLPSQALRSTQNTFPGAKLLAYVKVLSLNANILAQKFLPIKSEEQNVFIPSIDMSVSMEFSTRTGNVASLPAFVILQVCCTVTGQKLSSWSLGTLPFYSSCLQYWQHLKTLDNFNILRTRQFLKIWLHLSIESHMCRLYFQDYFSMHKAAVSIYLHWIQWLKSSSCIKYVLGLMPL